jgi:lysophospholipase L1-like esterase
MGINGQQSRTLLDWDQALLTEQLHRRAPGLIVLAYGTNEALYPHWTRDVYKSQLLALIANLRRAAPGVAILLVGPPECGRLRPFPYLTQIVEVQSEVAKETGSAFWNWALHMHESGGRAEWVKAGLSQADYTHLTADGYRLLGKTIAEELILEYRRRVSPELSQSFRPKP